MQLFCLHLRTSVKILVHILPSVFESARVHTHTHTLTHSLTHSHTHTPLRRHFNEITPLFNITIVMFLNFWIHYQMPSKHLTE